MNAKQEKIANLTDKAQRDLKAAEVLLREDDADFHSGSICFHCQQCVEKYFKAFLASNDIHAPNTHDLVYLCTLCSDFDAQFDSFDLSGFASYGVDIRYDVPIPTLDEAKNAFETSVKITQYVKRCIFTEGEQCQD